MNDDELPALTVDVTRARGCPRAGGSLDLGILCRCTGDGCRTCRNAIDCDLVLDDARKALRGAWQAVCEMRRELALVRRGIAE